MIKINYDFFIDSFESQIMEIDKSGPITVLIQVYYFIACHIGSGAEFRVVMWLG